MMQFFHSGMFSLIHCSTAGSAYRLSTAMSKNPYKRHRLAQEGEGLAGGPTALLPALTWICEACRSMVMMWSAPATDSMLATSLAEMGARL